MSNGYEEIAEHFIRARNSRIGPRSVLEWSASLPPGCEILDLGCGHGRPIGEALTGAGFRIYSVDASQKLLATFRERFPQAETDCAAAEESAFFHRTWDAVIAWGLLFLLAADRQKTVIARVARALNPGGRFLFTAPQQAITWQDSLTGRESISLGAGAYVQILHAEGLALDGNASDEGGNYYYLVSRPSSTGNLWLTTAR